VKTADTLTEILNDPAIGGGALDDLSAKIVHAMGYLCGHGRTRNEEVMDAVRRCLENNGHLDSATINEQAAEPVNELDEELDEDF
jgi:hypothetical protein